MVPRSSTDPPGVIANPLLLSPSKGVISLSMNMPEPEPVSESHAEQPSLHNLVMAQKVYYGFSLLDPVTEVFIGEFTKEDPALVALDPSREGTVVLDGILVYVASGMIQVRVESDLYRKTKIHFVDLDNQVYPHPLPEKPRIRVGVFEP